MFNFFKKPTPVITSHNLPTEAGVPKKSPPTEVKIKLSGLHCSSCAVNIDLALEDLPSVESTTNYPKSETNISFDPQKIKLKEIKQKLTDLGYLK